MKRFDEPKEVVESSRLKKTRILDGIKETDGGFEITQEENERGLADNGMACYPEAYVSGGFNGTEATLDFERENLGDLSVLNEWDLDINFNLLFGSEEGKQKHGVGFDLNDPIVPAVEAGIDIDPSLLNKKQVEVIEILSDDDDDEVEIIEVRGPCKSNVDQMKVGVSDITENVDLGLKMNYFVGESSTMASEERDKDKSDNSWLLLWDPDQNGADLWPNYEFPMDVDELRKVIEFIPQRPADLSEKPLIELGLRQVEGTLGQLRPIPAVSREATLQLAPLIDSNLRQEEATVRQLRPTSAVSRETALELARANYPSGGSNIVLANQEKTSTEVNEQLGKSFGLFSEAFRIIKERTKKKAAQELIEWKPSQVNRERSIASSHVPSLLNLSLKCLAENAANIVSLELVPSFLRQRLIDRLCNYRRMDVHMLNLLVEGYPDEIRVKNCSWLTEEQFQQTLANCMTQNLSVLQLDLCGQILFDLAFRDIYTKSPNSFSSLTMVSLRGACRLTDTGVKELLVAAPALLSLNLGQCTLLTCESINSIAYSVGSNLRELYIDYCLKINVIEILPAFKKFENLEILSVAGIQTVTDIFVSEVAIVCGPRIKELDLENCLELTDCSLEFIGKNCFNLLSVNLSNLHKLTDLGIAHLANGCRSIQMLELCRNKFSDEAIAAFLESAGASLLKLSLNNVTKVWDNTAFSLAKCAKKLSSLDISWCRRITNEAVGLIVDSCSLLTELKIFGCRQITDVLVNGHSNPRVRIIGLNLTPLLNHVNSIEPDEVFNFPPLPIS